jgi:hypothetical protein
MIQDMSNIENMPRANQRTIAMGWLVGAALVAGLLFLTGCTSVGKPMRLDPKKTSSKADAWYIEGKHKGSAYSCSFVEFDGRGDYLDFEQHQHAWQKVKELATKEKILLVFYCHGWKNNSQSGDVVEFNSFLGRLAASPSVAGFGYRVHGIYLGWRGNLYKPFVDKESEFFAQTTEDFGNEEIVNGDQSRRWSWTRTIPETLSYWNRRHAAEHQVSSIPIARTVYTCASLVKAIDRNEHREGLMNSSRVMVMGHSFGALLLERALSPASISALTEEWPWFGKTKGAEPANPLPLDFVLFVNSAAPAIYAKEMRDFLSAHRSALNHSQIKNGPVLISLTSTADKATRIIHRIGNLFAPLHPSLQRNYNDLLQTPPQSSSKDTKTREYPVHQSAFFNRTPGHQPLLVDHWIVKEKDVEKQTHADVLDYNLDYDATDPYEFLTSNLRKGAFQPATSWRITNQVPKDQIEWRKQFHGLPPHPWPSSYWFLRCDKALINGHNDCWSSTTMELYAALYRLVEAERIQRASVPGAANEPAAVSPGKP